MKGHVRKRDKTWYYQFRLPEKGPDGSEPTETKGGFATEKAAWEACRTAIAAVEGDKHVKKAKTTVKSFLLEWLPAIEMIVDATTYDRRRRRHPRCHPPVGRTPRTPWDDTQLG
ncbi:Arm DNA-binding domain-containing protein [Nocardia sp. NBC_01503]|uniref:Arm DNA-binding domain-containing protein n=1 Tax=Nocardia sp. NBC_01503 TaxID=2975997 RepID=UPI002E7C2B9A|nr:Arm DNA-binding domain-containing protein [Nocardia sp. NBC_01503]WTL29069.1 Arm DNA-binding domain-containing protein [Nocardia sp. NBC_01503]